MRGVHLDKRLSPILDNGERITPAFTTYLQAGCGFGGSCFPKDVKALIAYGEKCNSPMHLLNAVIKINEQQPQKILNILKANFSSLKGIPIAVLGLAFKPGTDDMRESPAIPIVKELQAQKAKITAFDPLAKNHAQNIFGDDNITYCNSLEKAIQNVEVIILLSRCEEFRALPGMMSNLKPQPLFIDGRRMLNKNHIEKYEGIGWNKKSVG